MLVFHFVELRKLPRLAFFANFFIVVAAGVGGIEVKSFVNPFEMSVKGHQNKIQYIKGTKSGAGHNREWKMETNKQQQQQQQTCSFLLQTTQRSTTGHNGNQAKNENNKI
ncbi:hypothetical protein BLOT_012735 [Blomia tropicalis]|nr:hypothetical protein BLOT_012735 [Blomia tropicalis]